MVSNRAYCWVWPANGKKKIKEKELQGFKHFKLLLPALAELHDHKCDKAGNRRLHYDQLTALILLYFFNPIVTDRLDVPPEVIALIYECRWVIEIFFRFFKHVLGCRHLISHCENGIEIQVYLGIIACLLIALWTGKKPTLRTYEMICYFLSGLADEEELLAHIEKLAAQS